MYCGVDIPPIEVKVANGLMARLSFIIRQFTSSVDGFRDTPLELMLWCSLLVPIYMVLGIDWLEQFRPMTCDWQEKWVQVPCHET